MTNNPKTKRSAERIESLIAEGRVLATQETRSSDGYGAYFDGEAKVQVQSWLIRVSNILESVFGPQSSHFFHFKDTTKEGFKFVEDKHHLELILGLLIGGLDDLKNGYLQGQEFLLASEVHDSILWQAKELCRKDFIDAAAILARVVLEDVLRRIAAAEGIDSNNKASGLNDKFKEEKIYPQPQWRLVQAWLDIGNSAAHGKTNDYDRETVGKMVEDVERFLVSQMAGRT